MRKTRHAAAEHAAPRVATAVATADPNATRLRFAAITALLFCSGLSALIFQIAWLGELRLVFGSATPASAAVLAIFMGGLGAGNLVLGPRADRHPNPLALYAWWILGIAVTAAVSVWLIIAVRAAYVALGGQTTLGVFGATVVRLLLSAVVLGPPTFLMGGTLPAAARAVTTAFDPHRRRVAWIYGFNTLGSVAGALASTFLLLELFGTQRTIWIAATLNLLIWWAARIVSRKYVQPAIASEAEADIGRSRGDTHESTQRPPAGGTPVSAITNPPTSAVSAARSRLVFAAAGVVGFAFLLMELVWYRMLSPLLGGSTYTFGLILATALLGIGLGGAAYSRLFRSAAPTFRALAICCALEAIAVAIPLALGDRLAVLAILVRNLAAFGFWGQIAGWMLITAIVILPAAFAAGIQFPLLIGLLGHGSRHVGRQVGLAFAYNTAGAIAGSLAGGFGLLPGLTAPGAWRLVVALLALVALAAAVLADRRAFRPTAWLAPIGLPLVALALLFARGPTAVWRHSSIGAGRAVVPEWTENALVDWMHSIRRTTIWEAEGIASSVALVDTDGLAFFINGKSDGNAIGDAPTQIMLGLLGAILHPQPRTALVVGLGTGESAGWLADVPSMVRVDVVELEPAVDEVARRAAAINRNVLEHPKVNRIYNDAREVLLTTSQEYDLVVSEPSNPYRAGISSLYTREFYGAVERRLADGGLFVQWLQAYEIDAQAVRTVLATLRTAFPYVEIWQSKPADMLLVCSRAPIAYRIDALRERIRGEPFRSALATAWRATDLEGVLARYIAGPALAERIAAGATDLVNTDDRNLLEYGLARTVGRSTGFSVSRLREAAIAGGADRPRSSGGEVDWESAVDQQVALHVLNGETAPAYPNFTRHQEARRTAILRYMRGDLVGAVAAWREQPRAPIHPMELAVLAHAHAAALDADAATMIEQLRAVQPTEARIVSARLLSRQENWPAAAEALEEALIEMRTDPWPLAQLAQLSWALAEEISKHDRTQAPRLYRALLPPFAVDNLSEQRRFAAYRIGGLLPPADALPAIEAFEPHIPWTADFLHNRYRAYEAARDSRAAAALDDISKFLSRAPDEDLSLSN